MRSNDLCDLSARGSSIPLNKLVTQRSSGKQKQQKKYEFVVSNNSANPKLVVVSNVFSPSPSGPVSPSEPSAIKGSIHSRITITTGGIRAVNSQTTTPAEPNSIPLA
jgi:hypothetical protein